MILNVLIINNFIDLVIFEFIVIFIFSKLVNILVILCFFMKLKMIFYMYFNVSLLKNRVNILKGWGSNLKKIKVSFVRVMEYIMNFNWFLCFNFEIILMVKNFEIR